MFPVQFIVFYTILLGAYFQMISCAQLHCVTGYNVTSGGLVEERWASQRCDWSEHRCGTMAFHYSVKIGKKLVFKFYIESFSKKCIYI